MVIDSLLRGCIFTSAVMLGVYYGFKDVLVMTLHGTCTVGYFLPFFFFFEDGTCNSSLRGTPWLGSSHCFLSKRKFFFQKELKQCRYGESEVITHILSLLPPMDSNTSLTLRFQTVPLKSLQFFACLKAREVYWFKLRWSVLFSF